MAVPGVITNSARALMDFVDFIMVSRLKSDDAQAAVLSAQMYLWAYICLGVGVVSMVNTFASQALGRQQPRECSAYAWQTVYIAAAFGLVSLAFFPFLPVHFAWVGHSSGVQEMELAFAEVGLLNVGPTIASFGLSAFFMGVHRPYLAMWSVLEANVVNVVASLILMFGFFGIEPMGIAGAAWGTLIATCYRVVRLAAPMMMPGFSATFQSRETWKFSWKHTRDLFRVGTPLGLQWMSEILVWALFVSILVGKLFGTADLIATNIAWQYMRISFLPTIGVGQALTALVGKSIGAGHPERALRETRLVVWITCTYMGATSLVYWFAGDHLIGWFNADPKVVEVGAGVMICAAVFQLFDALGITYISALRGAGDTVAPAIAMTVSHWLVVIGAGWWMAVTFPSLGSIGPWIAASALIIIISFYLWWRWAGGTWRKIDLFKAGQGE